MAPCRFTVKVRCGDIDGVSCAQELSIGADIGMITSIIRAVERVTMQTVMQQITRHTCHAPKWLSLVGAMGFFFFLLKGLAWLVVVVWLVLCFFWVFFFVLFFFWFFVCFFWLLSVL